MAAIHTLQCAASGYPSGVASLQSSFCFTGHANLVIYFEVHKFFYYLRIGNIIVKVPIAY